MEKNEKPNGSIRMKITVSILLIVVLSFLVIAYLNYSGEKTRSAAALTVKLNNAAELSSIALTDPVWNFNEQAVANFGAAILKDPEMATIQVVDSSGKVLFPTAATKLKKGSAYDKTYLKSAEKDIARDGKTIGRIKVQVTQYYAAEVLKSILMSSIINLVVMSGILVVIIAYVSAVITKPLGELCEVIGRVTDGDLTARVLHSSNDEVGVLANKINEMTEQLFLLVNKIREAAETISSSSEQLAASTTSNLEITEEIAVSSKHIAEGTDHQSESIAEVTNVVREMDNIINLMKNDIAGAVSSARISTNFAEEGMQAADHAVVKMAEMHDAVSRSAEIIKGLADLSSRIATFVDLITNITSQTNLLSLNASIEAARAGDAGRGFAVVANEVKKLAEQSSSAADQISNVVGEIRVSINNAVKNMEVGFKKVEESTETVTLAGNSLKQIYQSTIDVNNIVLHIEEEAISQTKESKEIVDEVSKIANDAASTAASAEETSVSVESQKHSLEEISGAIYALTSTAEELLSQITKFKTT